MNINKAQKTQKNVDRKQIENRRQEDQEVLEGAERRGLELAEGVCKLEDKLMVILNSRKLLDAIGNLTE